MMGEGISPFSSSPLTPKHVKDFGSENKIDASNRLPSESIDEIFKKEKKKTKDGKDINKITKKNKDKTEGKKDIKKDKEGKTEGKTAQHHSTAVSKNTELGKGQGNSKNRKKTIKLKSMENELEKKPILANHQKEEKNEWSLNMLVEKGQDEHDQSLLFQTEYVERLSAKENPPSDFKDDDKNQSSKAKANDHTVLFFPPKKRGKKSKLIKCDDGETKYSEVNDLKSKEDIAKMVHCPLENLRPSDEDKNLKIKVEKEFPILEEILYPLNIPKLDAFSQTNNDSFSSYELPLSQSARNSKEIVDGNISNHKDERENPYLNVTHKKLRNLKKKLTRIHDLEAKVQTSKIRDITKILNPEQIELLSFKQTLLGKIKDVESIHNALLDVMMNLGNEENNGPVWNENDLEYPSKVSQDTTSVHESGEVGPLHNMETSNENPETAEIQEEKIPANASDCNCNENVMNPKQCIIMEKSVLEAMKNAYFRSLEEIEFNIKQRENLTKNLKANEKRLKEVKDKYNEAEVCKENLKIENLNMEENIKELNEKLSLASSFIDSDVLKTTIKEISMFLGVDGLEHEEIKKKHFMQGPPTQTELMHDKKTEINMEETGDNISVSSIKENQEDFSSPKSGAKVVEPETNINIISNDDAREKVKTINDCCESTKIEEAIKSPEIVDDQRFHNRCNDVKPCNIIQNKDFNEASSNTGNALRHLSDMRQQPSSIPPNNYFRQMQQYHQQLQHFLFQHYPHGYPIAGLPPPPLPSHLPALPHQIHQFPPNPSQIHPSQPSQAPIQQPLQTPYYLNMPPPFTLINQRIMEMYQECNNLLQQHHHQQQQQQQQPQHERFNVSSNQNLTSNIESQATKEELKDLRLPNQSTVGNVDSVQNNFISLNVPHSVENKISEPKDHLNEQNSAYENVPNDNNCFGIVSPSVNSNKVENRFNSKLSNLELIKDQNDSNQPEVNNLSNIDHVFLPQQIANVPTTEPRLDNLNSISTNTVIFQSSEGDSKLNENILQNKILSLEDRATNFPLSFVMDNGKAVQESSTSACPLPIGANVISQPTEFSKPAECASVDDREKVTKRRQNKINREEPLEKMKGPTETNSNSSGSGSKKKWYYRNNNKSKGTKQQKC